MSARRDRRRRRRRQGGAGRVTLLTLGVFIAMGIVGTLSAVGYVFGIASSAPDLSSLKPQDPGRLSVILASDGRRLGVVQNDILRFTVPSTKMPQNVRDATVAIEDRRFYSHKGVDVEGIIRAAFKNFSSGETVQGGSTLTMQLIRTLYITRERTFKRKIREAKLAEELENVHPGREGKEWILTKYLNSVSYGTNGGQTAVGIQAAARIYFDKPADQLELQEAAMLAGLPQAPSAYNPFTEPGRATARRNDVLRQMAKQGVVTGSAAAAAIAKPLGVKKNGYFRDKRESYFFDYVTDELVKEYGLKTVRSGGLRVRTTIDIGLQDKARAAIAKDLSFGGAPSSAIVSIDPATGYIRAMASSAKYKDSKFNLAADGKRQPGSSFKVMALVAAVDAGVNPATTTYTSKRLKFVSPGYGPIDVNCYGGRCSGSSKNLIQATLSSDNSVYTQLALDIGPDKVVKAARGLGIKSKLEGVPSETLGGLARCCSPLEMANAYATIASGGWRNKPKAITQVRFPDGKTDDLSKPRRHKAFDSAAMYEVTKILDENVPNGTGRLAQLPNCPAAGKTGTTDKNTDAWFVGFTPKLATAVWVGFPKGRVPMGPLFHGANVDGGTFPAQIWGYYMKAASVGGCPKQFAKPGHPFKPRPFKGKYATGGVQTGIPFDNAPSFQRRPYPKSTPPPKTTPDPGATGGENFDPGATPVTPDPGAQTPPVPVPPTPPPIPSDRGNGNGGQGAVAAPPGR